MRHLLPLLLVAGLVACAPKPPESAPPRKPPVSATNNADPAEEQAPPDDPTVPDERIEPHPNWLVLRPVPRDDAWEGYHFQVGDDDHPTPEVELRAKLRDYAARTADGLPGMDEAEYPRSGNPLVFRAGPRISTIALSEFLSMLSAARMYRYLLCLAPENGAERLLSLRLPIDGDPLFERFFSPRENSEDESPKTEEPTERRLPPLRHPEELDIIVLLGADGGIYGYETQRLSTIRIHDETAFRIENLAPLGAGTLHDELYEEIRDHLTNALVSRANESQPGIDTIRINLHRKWGSLREPAPYDWVVTFLALDAARDATRDSDVLVAIRR